MLISTAHFPNSKFRELTQQEEEEEEAITVIKQTNDLCTNYTPNSTTKWKRNLSKENSSASAAGRFVSFTVLHQTGDE